MRRGLALWLFVFAWPCLAFQVPELTGPVVDEAGLLSPGDERYLQEMLHKLHESRKVQMVVLIVSSLQEQDLASYSLAVVEKWKLGKKGEDQGLLFLVAPNDRKMRMEVGYGLEGELTDIFTKRVQDDLVKPYFREKRYGEGILVAVVAVAKQLGVDLQTPVASKPPPQFRSRRSGFSPLLILLVLLFLGLSSLFGGGGRRRFGGGGWGGGGGGFGGFGGFGGRGGGFGGGGGGFGGGGSSSSW